MAAKAPDIASAGDGVPSDRRDLVLRRARPLNRTLSSFLKRQINLGERKAGDLHVKAQIHQRLELDSQYLFVPPRIEGELVVGDDIGTPFRGAKMRKGQCGDRGHSKQPGRLNASVAG